MAKILIAESLDEKILAEIGRGTKLKFVYQPDISPAELEKKIIPYDGLIVRPKRVSAKAIAKAAKLKLIVRGGAGVNSIALDACRKKGIIVENTPGLNSDATAEFTVLLMLQVFCRRQVEKADKLARRGNPGIPEDFTGRQLKDQKLGIIGFGNIGQRVMKIAAGFGMEISVFKRGMNLAKFLGLQHDIISLHIPLTAETKDMFGEKEFRLLKQGCMIINTARPQLIEMKAFAKALKSDRLSGFAIDGDYELIKPFIKADLKRKGIITHHIADATLEAQGAITRQALKQAVEFFENGVELNRVV
jgi:D-3-phosphoglycerate dehydrogenase